MAKTAPLTKQQIDAYTDAQRGGERLVKIVRDEAEQLKGKAGFDPEILVGREYPGRLQRGITRGAERLTIAAEGVAAAAYGAQCLAADAEVKPFKLRNVGPSGGARVKGRIFVDRAAVKKVLADFPHFVSQSEHHRATIGRMESDLARGGARKGTDVVQTILTDSKQTFADFEYYLTYLKGHAEKMAAAIAAVDEGTSARHPFPPIKIKGRPPRVDKPGGKAGASKGTAKMPAGKWPGDHATKQQIACWLARKAEEAGLPPELPLVCALPESNLDPKVVNAQGSGAVGLFQMLDKNVPSGYGSASGKPASAEWWGAHPEAQWDWFKKEARDYKPSGSVAGKDVARWANAIERSGHPEIYSGAYAQAKSMAAACAKTAAGSTHVGSTHTSKTGGGSSVTTKNGKHLYNAEALRIALSQKGVRESGNGSNWGPKVSEYLRSTEINFPAYWCAAFVHWALEKAGFKFPGGDRKWAACESYLAEARKENGAMYSVAPSDAKPGDLLVLNNGEHIAMVQSVSGGTITVIGGNQSNAVTNAFHKTNGGYFTIVRPRAQ